MKKDITAGEGCRGVVGGERPAPEGAARHRSPRRSAHGRTSCDLLAKPVQKDGRKLVGSAGSKYLFFVKGELRSSEECWFEGKNGKERA
jgi:hypothetical protein